MNTVMEKYVVNEKGQAVPGATLPVTATAFAPCDHTQIYWLGNAGVLLNVRGTVIMIDPLLEGFDMPLLFDMPIRPEDVPALDGLLITHIDNDHFSRETCLDLRAVCRGFHAPSYVAEQMREIGIPGAGHEIGERFALGSTGVTLTPAKHDWQNGIPKFNYRVWEERDYCGYWFDTPDGSIWLPGDSRLLESHLHMPEPDVILFDFSDNAWHITLDGAVRLANTYPNAKLVCIHWGTVDAPDMTPFNGNPGSLLGRITNPERLLVLFPGEKMTLEAKQ